MPSGRKNPKDLDKIRKAVADILTYHKDKVKFIAGKPSPESVRKLIKEYYDYETTRQFIHKVVREGEYGKFVDTLSIEDDPRIKELKEALLVQQGIWKDKENKSKDRTMASNAWRALQNQLINYERDLSDIKIKETEASRPIYLIKFFPPSVDVICPKCGHSWFDVRNEEDAKETNKEVKRLDREKEKRGKDWKPFYTKDCDEQKGLDYFDKEDVKISDELGKKIKKSDFKIKVDDAGK